MAEYDAYERRKVIERWNKRVEEKKFQENKNRIAAEAKVQFFSIQQKIINKLGNKFD